MKYDPRVPQEGINVSKEHPLVEASTLVIGLGLIFATIALVLIFMVEIALYFVPPEKEAALFDNWLPEDISTVSPNDERLAKVDNVLARLARHYPDSPYTFRIEIDESEYLNAMALPGGLIIVTSALVDRIESENELAFVLGHELGHFRNRDHIRTLGRGVIFGLVFVAISGNNSSGYLSASVADLAIRGFGRRQELQADLFGLELVQSEYGHVANAWHFFERLEEGDHSSLEFLSYLSTHPRT